MIYYLKINRDEPYTFRNLQNWIDAIAKNPKDKIFILCDKVNLKNKVKEKVVMNDMMIEFIESYKYVSEIQEIVSYTTDEIWKNAGFAHLTTFWHAKENGYKYFWNIDADDTCICLAPERVYEMLLLVEKYAKINDIHLFSLDMHRSQNSGNFWSFGITYSNNEIDWIRLIEKNCKTDEWINKSKILEKYHEKSVDWFFTYLKIKEELRIETFYFENLTFIHYSNDFFKRLLMSGMYQYRQEKIIFPILYYCCGIKEEGIIPIYEDVIKFDIEIKNNESTLFIIEHSFDKESLLPNGFYKENDYTKDIWQVFNMK